MLDIKELKRIAPLLRLTEVCKQAGLSYQSIAAKLHRESELSVVESEKIKRTLLEILKHI